MPECVPAGVTDQQAELIVTTYLNSHPEELFVLAELLVQKAIADSSRCRY